MGAQYDAEKAQRLIATARQQYAARGTIWTAEALDLADQLEAARSRIAELEGVASRAASVFERFAAQIEDEDEDRANYETAARQLREYLAGVRDPLDRTKP